MNPLSRVLFIGAVLMGGAALHAMFEGWDFWLGSGLGFIVAVWAGRLWERLDKAA